MERYGRYMLTFTGKKFYPYDLRPGDICIEDIAHGLAGEYRFGCQSPRRITVAEHCLLVSQTTGLRGLLHDASEGYIKDIPSPAKYRLNDYKVLEAAVMAAVANQFGLTPGFEHDKDVKISDALVLEMEQKVAWFDKDQLIPRGTGVQCWTPFQAEQLFLKRYYDLISLG